MQNARMTAHNENRVGRQRERQGYRPASEAPITPETAGRRCRKCRHFAHADRPRCGCGDFPVTSYATCAWWVQA